MSRNRAIQALNLKPTDMIASMEFLTGLLAENLFAITNIDPDADYRASLLRLIEIMEIDIHGPLPEKDNLAAEPNRKIQMLNLPKLIGD